MQKKFTEHFSDYYDLHFLSKRYGSQNVKNIYDAMDLCHVIKIHKKIKCIKNTFFSKKSKLLYKIMMKDFKNFDNLLLFFKKKYFKLNFFNIK